VPPITPQLAWRVAVLAAIAFVLFATVFFRLWSCRCSRAAGSSQWRRTTGRRVVPIEAPRGDIVDRNNAMLVTTRRAAVVQIVPSSLPPAVRTQGNDYHVALSAAERARQDAEARSKALQRQLRDDGRKSTKAESTEAAKLRAAASTAKAVPIAPLPATSRRWRCSTGGSARAGIRGQTVHERVIRGLAEAPYANITIRTDVPRAEFDYMRDAAGAVPRRRDHRHVPARVSARVARGPALRNRVAAEGPERTRAAL